MDLNECVMQYLIDDRLAEARARGVRAQLLGSLSDEPAGLKAAAGRALIQVGRWLAGPGTDDGGVAAPALEGWRAAPAGGGTGTRRGEAS